MDHSIASVSLMTFRDLWCFTEMKAWATGIMSQCIISYVLWEPNCLKWPLLSSLGGWPGVQGGGAEIWTLIKAFIPSRVSKSGQWRCCTCNGPAGCSLSPTRPRFSVTYCTRVLRIRIFRPLNPFNRVFVNIHGNVKDVFLIPNTDSVELYMCTVPFWFSEFSI